MCILTRFLTIFVMFLLKYVNFQDICSLLHYSTIMSKNIWIPPPPSNADYTKLYPVYPAKNTSISQNLSPVNGYIHNHTQLIILSNFHT